MKLLFLILINSVILFHAEAFGAACCGGGSSTATILSGDDRAQLAVSYGYTRVVVDNVDQDQIWRTQSNHQITRTTRIDGAHAIGDRWQVGGSLPIIHRTFMNDSSVGISDIVGSLGYEYLPDWDYNPWRPRGVSYLQVTLPTGKSRAEATDGGIDSRGNGFWALGLGTVLHKSYRRYDGFVSIEGHRSFGKSIHTNEVDGRLEPGWGSNWGFGAGYALHNWHLTTSIMWTYEDPVKVAGHKGLPERYATGALSLSYSLPKEWIATLSYSDQTLFGDPVNTSLGRGASLQILKHWLR